MSPCAQSTLSKCWLPLWEVLGLACLPDEAKNQSDQCLIQCAMVVREDGLIPSDSVLFTSCRLTLQMLFTQWLGDACQFG